MSFSLSRDINNKAVKKNVTVRNFINPNSLKASIGTTGSSQFIVLDTLNLNNVLVTATATQLNYLQVTPGIADASKALVLDSSRNISGINAITLNTNIIVNGTTITSNADMTSGPSDDLNNPYLTNIILGKASSSKALILNTNGDITKINKSTVNNLNINNYNMKLLNNEKVYNMETINALNLLNPTWINYGLSLNESVALNDSNFQIYQGKWFDVCWSPDLELIVAISYGNDNTASANRIVTSTDGIYWTLRSSTDNTAAWYSITWSPELGLFIVVGNGGRIMSSPDGINWTARNLSLNSNLQSVCWSPELNLFVAVANNGVGIRVFRSSDGITWLNSNPLNYLINWKSVCWANKLNMFIAIASSASNFIQRCMISTDGINWRFVSHSLLNNSNWESICWSEDLGVLIAVGSTSPNKIIRSYDGINWFKAYANELSTPQLWFYNPTSCIWIKELNIFVAPLNAGLSPSSLFYISSDGIRWKSISTSNVNSPYKAVTWSPKLGILILVADTGSNRIVVTTSIKTSMNGIRNKNMIYTDNINNRIGFNTTSPSKSFEINHPTGQCIKFYNNSNNFNAYTAFNIQSNGQLNLDANTAANNPINININSDFSSYGLKLNNILLKPIITEYSYISNITNGIASSSKVIVLDNNLDISNINELSCQSLIINGNPINDSNNNNYLQNINLGNASASKALLPDSNKNIININQISTNNLNLNYDKLFGSNINESININALTNKYKPPPQSYIINKLQSTNWIQSNAPNNTSFMYDMCWSPELNLLVAVCDTSRIYISTNGVSWTEVLNSTSFSNSYTLSCITWASELGMFIVGLNNGGANGYLISYNGYTWSHSQSLSDFQRPNAKKIIWISDLKILLACGDKASSRNPIMVSRDGIAWKTVYSTSNNVSSCVWCNKWGLISMIDTSGSVYTSPDGINWTLRFTNTGSSFQYNAVWAQDLNMCIMTHNSTANTIYSFDGITWIKGGISGFVFYNTIWIPELNMFMTTGGFNQPFGYSFDGINWTSFTSPVVTSETNRWEVLYWCSDLGMLFSLNNGTTKKIAYNIVGLPYSSTYLYAHKSQLYINKNNGRMGLGTTSPSYQLHLTTDEAAKPSSSSWTIVSDSRLKNNIENADLNICYNIIKNLDLKRYTWKDSIFANNQFRIYDKTKLGWIADDVEEIFPKAVNHTNLFGIENCKTLNIDQIIASMYGCSQKIILDNENIDTEINDLNNRLNNIENFINSLNVIN